ncbi:MAG: DUF1329 domain-containing protein [Denitromonas halophila]|nr:MAG: DUF1329 domain-containing protein [Denitromonas halophila]TVT64831.1 MAG: DUF1329 domain-containing protein [Denitromonas halophila]
MRFGPPAILRTCATAGLLMCLSVSPITRATDALTPTGAERAGSADGRIPAWRGGLSTPPPGWQPEHGYPDPFADEVPLYVITPENMAAHLAELSPGLQALLKQRAGMRIPVYPTHRTLALPQSVYDATAKQRGQARVDGKRMLNYHQPAIPFSKPENAASVMFNHLNRWAGGVSSCSDWLPVHGSGSYYRVGWCQTIVQATHMDRLLQDGDGTYFLGRYDAPASLLGTIYLVHEPLDTAGDERRAWIYNAGQRRVRRAPNLAFDNTADGTEGLATIDDGGGFNGSLERYDWTLAGKRELLIPYNAYKLADPSLRYEDMLKGALIDPSLMRYERHRVWVVEATLAPGMSHVYQRRTFYIDEDSWQIVMAEAYDGHGELWRVSLLPTIQLWDVPVMIPRAQMIHDLHNGGLLVTGLDNERRKPSMRWNVKGELKAFMPNALR